MWWYHEISEDFNPTHKQKGLTEFIDLSRVSAPNINEDYNKAIKDDPNVFKKKNNFSSEYYDIYNQYNSLCEKPFQKFNMLKANWLYMSEKLYMYIICGNLSIFFELLKFSIKIALIPNDDIFWIKCTEYLNDNSGGKIGTFILEKFKKVTFDNKKIVLLDKFLIGLKKK